MPTVGLYEPLNTLAPVGPDLFVVDGPAIRFKGMPFPTRMTVARLGGELWVHSPIPLVDTLRAALADLGEVRHLVAPNTLHYWWVPDWKAAFPAARVYAAPGVSERAKRELRVDEVLAVVPPLAWGSAFDQVVVTGRIVTEAVFFHRASRTVVLSDLIENFEASRIASRPLRWLLRTAGCLDPDGKAPIDMRWSFVGRHAMLRAAVERMLAWDPEHVILAHGRWYDRDGRAELERAFRWV